MRPYLRSDFFLLVVTDCLWLIEPCFYLRNSQVHFTVTPVNCLPHFLHFDIIDLIVSKGRLLFNDR
jgi:hypothetical protein